MSSFVEIQGGVSVGHNCRIGSYTFLCSGVVVEDNVFIGSHVVTINDLRPSPHNPDYEQKKIIIRKNASIGSGVTILGGVEIGENAVIGAGATVVKNVPPNTTVVGPYAQPIKRKKSK